jgi:hypothetical protein
MDERQDVGHDMYLSDWNDADHELATAFGRFFEVFARVGADVDATLIADYGVAEDRRGAFGTEVLDEMGFSRKIRIMRGILARCGVPGGRPLANHLERAAAFRNRLVHDLLEWSSKPGIEWPSLSHRPVHGPTSDEHVVDAEALQDKVAELAALASRVRTALIQVQQKRKPD